MTTELVTGFADTPHVDAADDGALNAAIISDSNHVLGTPSPAVMRDSNHLTVPTMEALFLGRHVRVTSAEDVTITSGSQGLKRHDIVGFRYSRNPSTNVETAVLDVIRGTASSTPADPALPSGNILTGASSAFMPLYRVPLDGINVGTPVPLFNVLRPMRELWDSANQLPGIKSQISGLQSSANQLPGIKSQISGLQASINRERWQTGSVSVAAKALAAGNVHSWGITFPQPFAEIPIVLASGADSWATASVTKITTVGFQLDVRNFSSETKPVMTYDQPWAAYGKLA